jgi:hypothetical protein
MHGPMNIKSMCTVLLTLHLECIFQKSLKPEISVLYSTCYMLLARAQTQTHKKYEKVGMVKSAGKFILNEFIDQIRMKKQKYSVRMVKNDN